MSNEEGYVLTNAGHTALAEAYWREKIAKEIESIDISEAKEISSDWYGASSRMRMVCAIVARGKK